jgi:integrase
VTENCRSVRLVDPAGNHITNPADTEGAARAYAAYLLDREAAKTREGSGDRMPLMEVCRQYLDYCQRHNAPKTYAVRADFLFDFCTGYPPRYRDKGNGHTPEQPTEKDRIHPGYGKVTVAEMIPHHVTQWVESHKWDGGARTAIQAIKKTLNYCVSQGLIPRNPIRGYRTKMPGKRLTYFTQEQETALLENANPALRLALTVCIRTGARPFSEFAHLEARHVEESPKGQLWRFPPGESKTGKQTRKDRVIYCPEEIAEIVRQRVKLYPKGKLFRNRSGNPWTKGGMKSAMQRLRKKLASIGVKLDQDACIYTCRHTFAKRMLGGFWGRPVTLEVLAGLMGNSRQVCWAHYGKWCESYTDPFWDAIRNGHS